MTSSPFWFTPTVLVDRDALSTSYFVWLYCGLLFSRRGLESVSSLSHLRANHPFDTACQVLLVLDGVDKLSEKIVGAPNQDVLVELLSSLLSSHDGLKLLVTSGGSLQGNFREGSQQVRQSILWRENTAHFPTLVWVESTLSHVVMQF